MRFLDLFFTTTNKQPEPVQKKALNPSAMYPIIGSTGINWLNDNSQQYITNGYAGNPVIYSIIKQITDKMSAVPFYLYEIQDTKKLKRYKSFTLNKNLMSAEALIAKDQSLKEVDSHKIIDLLDQPNEYQQWSEFVKNAIGYKLITGNSYIYGAKAPEFSPNKGKIVGLTVLPAQLMNIVATGNVVEYYNLSGNNQRMEKDEVLHLKYWNPDFNNSLHLYGQSPLKAAHKVMQLSNTAYDTQGSIISNKGAYGMLFDKSQSLDDEQMQNLKDRFMNASANELMMVSADLQYTQFGQTAEDMQILESMNMNKEDLCNIYSFPSLLLGGQDKTFQNYAIAEKSLIYNVIVPELTTLRDSLNKWLCPAYSKADGKQYFIDFDITVLPQLAADMDKVVAQLSAMWWTTPNEKRLATNYGEDTKNPLMNEYFIPQNLVPISETSIQINDPNQDLSDYQ